MNWTIFLIVAFSCCLAVQSFRINPKLTSDENVEESIKAARQSIKPENRPENQNTMLENSLASIFTNLANATLTLNSNISTASATIAKGLTSQSLSLGGLILHAPRLFFLDGPQQMVEILRLMRTNQLEIPNNMESAIDTMIVFFNQAQRSGAGENFQLFFDSQTDILNGVGDLVNALVNGVFSFLVPF